MQYNSNDRGQMWVNGEKIGGRTGISGTIATNSTNFTIYTSEQLTEEYVKVKEAYVYNTELTDEEILRIYNSTKGRYF